MKIRYDFVTNSSSSSFVCWGVMVNKVEIADQIRLDFYNENCAGHACSKREFTIDQDKINCTKRCSEFTYGMFDKGNLSMGGPEIEYSAVGIKPTTLLLKYPDRKIGEVKTIAADELNQNFGTSFTEKDIMYFEEGWYDG